MAVGAGRLPVIEPMLATPVRDVPIVDADWAAEAKWDGARVLAYVSDGAVVLRNLGPDWHERKADRDRKIRAHVSQLRAMGLDVTITPAA
jgi:hypothetical protein